MESTAPQPEGKSRLARLAVLAVASVWSLLKMTVPLYIAASYFPDLVDWAWVPMIFCVLVAWSILDRLFPLPPPLGSIPLRKRSFPVVISESLVAVLVLVLLHLPLNPEMGMWWLAPFALVFWFRYLTWRLGAHQEPLEAWMPWAVSRSLLLLAIWIGVFQVSYSSDLWLYLAPVLCLGWLGVHWWRPSPQREGAESAVESA